MECYLLHNSIRSSQKSIKLTTIKISFLLVEIDKKDNNNKFIICSIFISL